MTHDPKTYRDPKVTTDHRSSGGAMRWIWIVAALIAIVLLLSWIFGGFGADTVTTVPAEDTAPAAATTEGTGTTTTGSTEGAATPPAADTQAPATTGSTEGAASPPAADSTAPGTEAPADGATTATPPAD